MSDLESEGYEEDGGPYLGVSLTILNPNLILKKWVSRQYVTA